MPVPVNPNDAPSLSVASLPRKAVVMAYSTKFILGRYPLDDTNAAPFRYNSIVVDDGQMVRAVAFLQIPAGPLCVVSAGDGKYINVYNISSWKGHNPKALQVSSSDEDKEVEEKGEVTTAEETAPAEKTPHTTAEVSAEYWKPAYQYGPHTKRITSLATSPEGTIIFADKFGEVYRLSLTWSPTHTIEVNGDAAKPAAFLLQHFSILSTIFLSGPIPRLEPLAESEERSAVACRHLFTCDKDCHARASRYPEAHVIEQFLWANTEAQSAVTCVAEIPYLEDALVYDTAYNAKPECVNKINKALNAPFCYYVTGTYAGDVHFWAAKTTVPEGSSEEPFHLVSTFCPRSAEGDEEDLGSVIAFTLLSCGVDEQGRPRHPRDTPRGLLVAYERSHDLFFIPLCDNVGKYGLHPAQVNVVRTHLPALPAAVVSSNDATAFVLTRDGVVSFVELTALSKEAAVADPAGTCRFQSEAHVAVRVMEVRMPYLEERIRALMCGPAPELKGSEAATEGGVAASTALETLDLSAPWRYEAVDPRTRRRNREGAEADSSESGEEHVGEGETPEWKKGGSRKGSKKARVEEA